MVRLSMLGVGSTIVEPSFGLNGRVILQTTIIGAGEFAIGWAREDGGKNVIPEVLRYRIATDKAEAFVRAYKEAGDALKRSPHCQGFELLRSSKDPELFLMIIRWDSPEGHMKGFRESAEFRDFCALVRPYLGDILEMEHYEYTEVRA